MAGRYLPTELQNDEGDVIYPHTDASVTWMQDGRSVEEVMKAKMEMVVSSIAIPVEQRTKGVMYAFIENEAAAASQASAVMASPSVGYRMV